MLKEHKREEELSVRGRWDGKAKREQGCKKMGLLDGNLATSMKIPLVASNNNNKPNILCTMDSFLRCSISVPDAERRSQLSTIGPCQDSGVRELLLHCC